MNKPYILFKNQKSPYWYAQIRLPDGSLTNNKSTRKECRADAEKVVMEWIVTGNIPSKRDRNGDVSETTSLEVVSILNALRTKVFTDADIDEILRVMKEKKYILSAVRPESQGAKDLEQYLLDFWNYDNSPYVREVRLKGKDIHKRHCMNMQAAIKLHWHPIINGKTVGEFTRDDTNKIFEAESLQNHASRTVIQTLNALTIPMKWALQHHLTDNNVYEGIIRPQGKPKTKTILTMEETRALFNAEWDNDSAKLACLLACYTGMRAGEIQGLRIQDIGEDRIYIRHSWGFYDHLKVPKNGDEREIMIPPKLRDMLIHQASFNPYNQGISGFVFFSKNPEKPVTTKMWTEYLRRALASIGYDHPENISMHCFRHEWCTTTLSDIGDMRICMIGSGHKTDKIFSHYANHIKKELALKKIAESSERIFAPILHSNYIDDAEYEVTDYERTLLPSEVEVSSIPTETYNTRSTQ